MGWTQDRKTTFAITSERFRPTTAVIFSTHILQEAEELCDRVIIIAQGRVVEDDKIVNLLDKTGPPRPCLCPVDGPPQCGVIMSEASKASFFKPLWAVFRHEWRQHIYSPLVAIFLCSFTLILSAAIFLVGDFFASDEASLRLLIVFLPWVCLVLVPALAMRSWGDETGRQQPRARIQPSHPI